MGAILEVEQLSKHFGGLAALSNVSFHLQEGEVLGLIGPNGAGKTTAINVISGFMRPSHGKVTFEGQNVTHLSTDVKANKGMVRTFQIVNSFPHLSVYSHLFLACLQAQRANPASLFFSSPGAKHKEKEAAQHVEELLDLMNLQNYRDNFPTHLPHGYQRWLFLGMALALRPRLVLLDEPLSGMNATEIDHTLELLRKIKKALNISILIIEHNMRAVVNFCDRIVVLQYGQKICEGIPGVVMKDPAVIEAYLGGEDVGVA